MQVREWSIKARLVMLSTVAVLGLIVLGLDSLNDMRNSMLQDRKDKTQVLVEIAGGVIARFHDLARRAAR
jgi:methyl-accepting chemotaxis protein